MSLIDPMLLGLDMIEAALERPPEPPPFVIEDKTDAEVHELRPVRSEEGRDEAHH